MTIDKNKHLLARVAIISAAVIAEESMREYLSPAAIWKRYPNGKIDKSSEKYIENKARKAIKEAKACLATIEKLFFQEGKSEVAQDELYKIFAIQQRALLLNDDQKAEVLDFMMQKLQGENEQS